MTKLGGTCGGYVCPKKLNNRIHLLFAERREHLQPLVRIQNLEVKK